MLLLSRGSLEPAGPVAQAAADLWELMLGLGTAVFLLFAGLLAFGLFARTSARSRRDASGEQSEGRADPSEARLTRRWIIAGGVVLPLVVITVVFGATLIAMRDTPRAAASDSLVIEVVGHQFRYEITYPGSGVTTVDELHLPVGRPVTFRLTSADVVHSFWIPELGGKMDMLPDGVNTLVLQADVPGEYHARCAEFCGLHHTRMTMRVVAQSDDDFAAWLDEQQESDPSAAGVGGGR